MSLDKKGKSCGFTLLEMMLTVGLIALTATFIGLNISQSDAKLADLEAKRFIALLNMALDESIVTGRPIQLKIDTGSHSYRFVPLELPQVFVYSYDEDKDKDEEQEPDQSGDSAAYRKKSDSLYQPRIVPEVVTIQFSRLPDAPELNADIGFVPKRVHEILNKSLFDSEPDTIEEKNEENSILIEPNGLISPFSLSLSVDGQVVNVELDRFGKAALLPTK